MLLEIYLTFTVASLFAVILITLVLCVYNLHNLIDMCLLSIKNIYQFIHTV